MRTFEITYFSNNDASSGTPHIQSFTCRDSGEAITEFNYLFPTKKVWSVDEVDPDYSLQNLNLD